MVLTLVTLVRSTKFPKNKFLLHYTASIEGVDHEKNLTFTTKDTTNISYIIN